MQENVYYTLKAIYKTFDQPFMPFYQLTNGTLKAADVFYGFSKSLTISFVLQAITRKMIHS